MNNIFKGLCILVATKNRTSQLTILLESISQSTLKPELVVIVCAGDDVSETISKYKSKLSIQMIRSEISSQVFQKKLGIDFIKNNYKWVLFLDDDLILDKVAIESLKNKYLDVKKFQNYLGFGLAIKNRNQRDLNSAVKFILWLFQLYSYKPGKITKSGHAQTYLNQQTCVDVDWLNGVSIWKSEVLKFYDQDQKTHAYSSYEDVTFSYRVRQTAQLLFAYNCFVSDQKLQMNTALTYQQFLYGSHLRYYFVHSNKEYSKFLLLVSQVIRSFEYVLRSRDERNFLQRIRQCINVWFSLLHLTIKNKNIQELIEKKLQAMASSITP